MESLGNPRPKLAEALANADLLVDRATIDRTIAQMAAPASPIRSTSRTGRCSTIASVAAAVNASPQPVVLTTRWGMGRSNSCCPPSEMNAPRPPRVMST